MESLGGDACIIIHEVGTAKMTELDAVPLDSNSKEEAVPWEPREDEGTSWIEEDAAKHPEKTRTIDYIHEIRSQLFRLNGHLLEIRSLAGHDSLFIDGRPEIYRVSRKGYVLERSGFSAEEPTLLAAAGSALGIVEQELPTAPIFDQLAPLDSGEWTTGRLTCSRSNFMSLTDNERDRLAIALNELYQQGTVAAFRSEHRRFTNQVHYGPAFLPWHRHFLLRFEGALRRVDPQLRIPYWDWTRDDSRNIDAEPWKSFFGGRNNQGGRFDSWDYNRAPRGADGRLPSLAAVANKLQDNSFSSFRALEGTHHDGPHVWVGGTMASLLEAAADPLFYLHHANVDRLWAMWQQNNPQIAQYTLDEAATDQRPDFDGSRIPIDDPMPGGATPRSMLDHTSLGVIYFERDQRLEDELPGFIDIDVTRRLGQLGDISFGRVIVNDLKIRKLTLRNTGSVRINVEVAGQEGQLSWHPFKGIIRPCESVQLNVFFSPEGTGPVDRTLTVQTDARGGNRTVRVSGRGIPGQVP